MRSLRTRSSHPAALAARLAVLAVLLVAVSLGAAETPSRIVAIGDIHGAWEPFVEILQRARLVDRNLDWIGGDTLFVQTGDFTDKGPDVRRVMDLLIALQTHAAEVGGQVSILMGNHEAMNLMGFTRDVDPATYAEFVDPGSEKRRLKAYKAHVKLTRKRVRDLEMAPVTFGNAAEQAWMSEHPPGLLEYLGAMSASGPYGRWIRSLPVTLRVGDLLFIHAGIGPESEALSAEEINRAVEADIRRFDATRAELIARGVALPTYSWQETQQAIVQEFNGYRDRGVRNEFLLEDEKAHMVWLADFLEFQGGNLTAGEGPLWFRGFARWQDDEGAAHAELLAAKHAVRSFISGHTPNTKARIRARFDGRILLIDTGMLESVYNGSASALEIREGRYTAIYPGGEELLLELSASVDNGEGAAQAPEAVAAPD